MPKMRFGLPSVAFLGVIAISSSVDGKTQGQSNTSSGSLKGQIVGTTDGFPVAHSFVLVHAENGQDKTIVTDESGRYELELSSGVYDVMIGKMGWEPICRELEIRAGHSAVFDAKLTPNWKHLER